MKFTDFSSLIINGKFHSKDELLELCTKKPNQPSIADWENHFYSFIREWLNESATIEVKTSGSTGIPKKILLEKNRLVKSAKMTLSYLNIQKEENALLSLSCNYIAGKMMIVRALVWGLNLIQTEPSSNPLQSLSAEQKIDFTAWVPLQLQSMLQYPESVNKIAGIKNILVGGAPLSYNVRKQIENFSNNIYETYGMTETISHIALKLLSRNSKQEYFETLDDITVQQDEKGCLIIHAIHLNESPIITNDMVELKDNRHFKWLGRLDNALNSGGIKFIPELLEKKIEHLFQQRFLLAGIPDEKLGEKMILIIEGENIPVHELESLKEKLKEHLDKYEMPREIKFSPLFSEGSNGKIQRKETLERVKDE